MESISYLLGSRKRMSFVQDTFAIGHKHHLIRVDVEDAMGVLANGHVFHVYVHFHITYKIQELQSLIQKTSSLARDIPEAS